MQIFNNNCQQILEADMDGMIIINGKVIPCKKNFTIQNGKIIIDGKTVQEYNNASLKIEITGSVKYIKTTSGDVTVKGDVTNVKTMSGGEKKKW